MKKVKIIGIGSIALIVVIGVIVALSGFRIDHFLQKAGYDNDGEIVKKSDFYYTQNYSRDFRNDKISLELTNVIGRKTLCNVTAAEKGKVSITYQSVVQSGKVKLVYVSEDNSITKILEDTAKGSGELDVPKGKGVIKLIADEATGRIELGYKTDSNVYITDVE